jgi:hypothetical protein
MTNDDLGYRQAEAAESTAQPEIATRDERGFVISVLDTAVADTGTLNVSLENGTSDTTANLVSVQYITDFDGEARLYDSFSSAPSGGTTLDIENLLLDEDDAADPGSMTARQDASFTSSGTHTERIIATAGPGPGGLANFTEVAPTIEPSRDVVFEITNTSGGSGRASIEVVYYEEDTVYSRE